MTSERKSEEVPTYSVEQATEEIRVHFPDLAIESIEFCGEGSDFCAYTVNDDLLFRFGANGESAERLHWERHLLPQLQVGLSVELPRFETFCQMGNGRPLVVYPMIKGEGFGRRVSENLSAEARPRVAKQLADFLRTLHSFPVDEALGYGVRERPIAETNREFREGAQETIYPKLTEREKTVLDSWFDTYASNPVYSSYKPALVHGDLQDRHVLFDPERERIAGIIDFSDIWISDPDYDLHYLRHDHGDDFLDEILRWYGHENLEGLRWKSRLFDLHRYLDEIIWGTEDGHTEHVQEGWRDLRRFLAGPGPDESNVDQSE